MLENTIQLAIAKKFGAAHPKPHAVEIGRQAHVGYRAPRLNAELHRRVGNPQNITPLPDQIIPLSPARACHLFITQYNDILEMLEKKKNIHAQINNKEYKMKRDISLCIYHGNCADGFGAAWVVRKALGDIDFHAGKYQAPPPDVTDKDVVIVDFSYKRPVLLEMAAKANSILILDHHKTHARRHG